MNERLFYCEDRNEAGRNGVTDVEISVSESEEKKTLQPSKYEL